VLEYLDMKGLTRYSRQLGEELARMHLHNVALGKKQKEQESYVGGQETESENEDEDKPVYMSQFGFHTTTCCGYLPQDNTFCDDWPVSICVIKSGSHKLTYWELKCLTLDALGCSVSHICFVFARYSVLMLARKVVSRTEIFILLPTKYRNSNLK
jgi:fructosamine-3-kinase